MDKGRTSFFGEGSGNAGEDLWKFRFDLYVCSEKRKAFIEVKGVTLESDNIARFPRCTDRKRCETSEGADPLYAGRIRSLSASGNPDEGS